MTSYLKIKGTFDEIDDLFENCHYISIRYFNHLGNNRWDVTVRHSENLTAVPPTNRYSTSC